MAHIVLVTGGTRSGKSSYAQRRAEELPGRRCFIATCRAADDEMKHRVSKHQAQRQAGRWDTIEEPFFIGACIEEHKQYNIFLVDCLTLWISNLMDDCQEQGTACTETVLTAAVEKVLQKVQQTDSTLFFVTNEVGLGIVPENRVARHFRDLVGLCNQILASHADEVVLVSCGLPLTLKK